METTTNGPILVVMKNLNTFKILILGSLTALLMSSCGTKESTPLEQLPLGKAALIRHCLTCHSTIEMQRGPLLQGLEEFYLEEQLEAFKAGARGLHPKDANGLLMHSAIKEISDDDLEFAADWFSRQTRPEMIKVIKGDLEKGAALYKAACYSCHEHPMGKLFSRSPDLYKSEDWYLLTQLRSYKAGWRGVDPRDEHGAKMKAAIEGFSMQELQDVVAYLGQFQQKPVSK